MTVAIVADITPRPLRTKADSVQKIVGYADTGVMLVAISVMVPNVERPDYLPLFLLQAAFVLVSAVVYDLLVKEPALVQKMRQKSLEMGIREDEVEKDDPRRPVARSTRPSRAGAGACCRRSRLQTAYIKMSQTSESARFGGLSRQNVR